MPSDEESDEESDEDSDGDGQPLTGHMIEENASYRVPKTHPRRSTESECAGCGATVTFTITDEEHLTLKVLLPNLLFSGE